MTTYRELEQYHNELISRLRDISIWMEEDTQDTAIEAINEISDEIDRAFYALRAQLPTAPMKEQK